MREFYLTTAVAVVFATSLASNLLWVMAFGPPTAGLHARLRSALAELASGLRDLADAWVTLRTVRRERPSTLHRLDDLSDRDLGDIGLHRNRFGLISTERNRHVAGGAASRLQAGIAASGRLR